MVNVSLQPAQAPLIDLEALQLLGYLRIFCTSVVIQCIFLHDQDGGTYSVALRDTEGS